MVLKELFCFNEISPIYIVISSILWIIDVAIIIFCIGQGFKYIYTNNKLQPFHKQSYWLCLLLFGIFSIVIALSGFACKSNSDFVIAITMFSLLLLSFSSQISVLYQLIGRVYYTFHGSSYAISERQFFILKLHCFIIFIGGCLSFVFITIDELQSSEPIQPLQWKFFAPLFLIIAIVYYWVISWRCVYLFASKIMKIVVTAMNSVRDITKIDTISINSKQKKFLDTITKHIVLASMKLSLTIISAIIILHFLIFMLLTTLNRTKTKEEQLKVGRIAFAIFGIIAMVDNGITVLTMYMHYQFANKVYLRLCHHCHHCFRKRWDKKAGHKMTERAINLHSKTEIELSVIMSDQTQKSEENI